VGIEKAWDTDPAVQVVFPGQSDSLDPGEVHAKYSSYGSGRHQVPEELRRLTGLRSLTLSGPSGGRTSSSARPTWVLPDWLDDLAALEKIDAREVRLANLPPLPRVRWALDAEDLYRFAEIVDPARVYAVRVNAATSRGALGNLLNNAQASWLSLSEMDFSDAVRIPPHRPSLIQQWTRYEWIADNIEAILKTQPQLQSLNIAGCPIGNVPLSIKKLIKLTHLSLVAIFLPTVPDWLFELPSLESLSLELNELSDLPSAIGGARHLRQLSLGANRFTHIPAGVWNLQALKGLYIPDCPIELIPSDILRLEELEDLRIKGRFLGDEDVPNELVTPPPEIAAQGLDAIKRTGFKKRKAVSTIWRRPSSLSSAKPVPAKRR
jgi:Leucine-rich repeat (LRR) protein